MSHSDYHSHNRAEIEAIRTGALNRFWNAMVCRWLGCKHASRYEMMMGWQRLTNTGDYALGGHFDRLRPGWRDSDDIGHGRVRTPQAAQQERVTDDNGPGDGKPRAMSIPLFLADE